MDEASADQQRNGHHQPTGRNGDSSEPQPGQALPPYSGPFYSLRLKIVVVLVVAASATALVLLYLRTSDGDDDPATSGQTASDGVESLHPAQGSQALQQDGVIVDLAPGWDGRLTVDGEAIPETDLTRSARQETPPAVGSPDASQPRGTEDRLEFVPGEDKVMNQLPTGRVCVTVEAWPRTTGPDSASADTITWCFTVL